MARIAEDVLLLLLDNESAQPVLAPSRLGRLLAAALLLDLAYDCRVRPALPSEPVPPGHLVALTGPVPLDPAVRPTLAVLEQGPIAAAAAIGKLHKRAHDDVLDQLLRSGQIHQVSLSKQRRLLRNTYAWPIKDRARADMIRATMHAVLFEHRRPDPLTAAVIALLHRTGCLASALNLSEDGARLAGGRAAEIAAGRWAQSSQTAEVNLDMTASAVLPAVG